MLKTVRKFAFYRNSKSIGSMNIRVDNQRIYQLKSFSSEYYSGAAGGVCNDISHVIRSQPECIKALQKLGFQVAFNHFWTGKYDKVPSGCSIDKVKRPYLEQSADGLGKGRNDLTPICKNSFPSGRF